LILVDTSVWIDFFKGVKTKEEKFLVSLIKKEEPVFITGIVLMEILQGIREKEQFNQVKEYLSAFPLAKIHEPQTYIKAADIYRKCKKKGITVRSPIDCLIAQIAIENDLYILHRDRDYTNIAKIIKELKIVKI